VRVVSVAREKAQYKKGIKSKAVCFGGQVTRTEVITKKNCPGEDVSCRSETKHDRRTVLRSKLFPLPRRIKEQNSKP
jgi:hypothetical protein